MNIKLCSKKQFIFFVSILFFAVSMSAQNVLLSSFGEEKNSNGQISYSVGQVINESKVSGQGSVSFGVQISYEVATLNVESTIFTQTIQSYPNPTTDFLNLKISDFKKGSLKYQLYDIKGTMLEKNNIETSLSLISMKNKPIGFYFLKVIDNQNIVQIFKIIKK